MRWAWGPFSAVACCSPKETLRPPIHLLRASDRGGAEAFEDQGPAWSWGECTRAGVVVGDVSGTHITMLAPPQVAVLAEKLVAVLAAGVTPARGSMRPFWQGGETHEPAGTGSPHCQRLHLSFPFSP